MMTTNKNQRTTHIDDVVKYQARPFFHSHCSLCDMRLFLQLFMHAFYIRRWKWWNYSHLHLHALSLSSSHSLAFTFHFTSFTIFPSFSLLNISNFLFSLATLYFILLFRWCKIMCRAKNLKRTHERSRKKHEWICAEMFHMHTKSDGMN